MGDYFRGRLESLVERHPVARSVRGRGLLLGLQLTVEGGPVVTRCLERGFVTNCVQGDVLRFAPPLVIETEQIDALVDCLDEVLADSR
jgi:acetylornithine/succinyldiaminopimelate/putrescine aminotransferase